MYGFTPGDDVGVTHRRPASLIEYSGTFVRYIRVGYGVPPRSCEIKVGYPGNSHWRRGDVIAVNIRDVHAIAAPAEKVRP